MRDMKRIEMVVKNVLAADFDKVKIFEVRVRDETDSDGDKVLRVEVIFEGARKDLDAGKLSGAVRHVRPKLSEIGEEAFPLFSFISKGDWSEGRLKSA
jgi:hypothetical protein